MARIDLTALQQRLTHPPPKAPASKARPAADEAVAPTGTLRATTTMRAAFPLKGKNLRAKRAEERARVNAMQAQVHELNAEMAAVRAEADRALAGERRRGDQLSKQVEALSAKLLQAEKQTAVAMDRAQHAEAGREAERGRAEALRSSIAELKAAQGTMVEVHARELAIARHDATAAQQAAAELRQAEAGRQARGLLARLVAAWRGA